MTHADGIYFGMPDDEYHAIPRLSASGIKEIVVSPLQFWFKSFLNPDREPDEDTTAKKLGKAYHKLILEGEEAFDACYAVAPCRDDHPDALDGAEALKAKCDELDLKKSGRIADLCERIRDADPAVKLWPDIMEAFRQSCAGREVLTKAQWLDLERVRFVLRHMPSIRSAFTGGRPEVTILWTHPSGVKMKARLDYLKPRGDTAAILDVKTFGNVMDKPIEDAPSVEIARNRYFVQPVIYTEARKAAAAMWAKHGMAAVHGETPDEAWLKAVLGPARSQFHFVFVKTGAIPDVIARGVAEYRYGVAMFRRCLEQYGTDTPWVQDYGVRAIRDDEFPLWALTTNLPMIDDQTEAAE
jgi:hypothetical protein